MLFRSTERSFVALESIRYLKTFVPPQLISVTLRSPHNNYSTQAQTEVKIDHVAAKSEEISLANARPFEQIPGPGKWEFLRSVLPGGIYYKKNANELINGLAQKYGNFFKMPGMFGRPPIFIALNPDDYSLIFRNEGQWPMRRSFETITYFREVYRKDFFEGMEGVLTTNGEKWSNIRTAINPVLMQPKNARLYLNTMLEVNDEFLKRIREIRDPVSLEMPDTFEEEINRLTLESVCAVALNTQLGLIRKNRDSAEGKTIIDSLRRYFDLTFELEILPSVWKIMKTPKFKEAMRLQDTLLNVCYKYISQALRKIECDTEGKLVSEVGKEQSVLEKLVRIDKKVAVVMALDMMMAGVDTTSSTLTGILLCIAKNPQKQAKLFDEIKQIMPEKNTKLTLESMRNLPYLRACIKEAIRLYPIIPGTTRRLPHDVVLSGYRVQQGNEIAIGANLLLRNEKYVPHANEFLPERWLRNDLESRQLAGEIVNPFMYVPFGFGPRSCAGKRIVELELEINLARLVRNFQMEFNYSTENAFRTKFISVPNIPLKFKFSEREQ